MALLAQIQEKKKQAYKPFTTIIQVARIETDRDPAKATLFGKDLLNKDENGVPREVSVRLHKAGENGYRTLNDFGRKSGLVATKPGGIIRIDRAIRKNDTTYVCKHLQRIAEDDTMIREDQNGEKHKKSVMDAWVKVIPETEAGARNTGRKYKVFKGKSEASIPQHRGRVYAIPAESKPVEVMLDGKNSKAAIEQLIDRAIADAPEKSNPFLLLRQVSSDNGKETVITKEVQASRTQGDDNGNQRLRSDAEVKASFMANPTIQAIMGAAINEPMTINTGFQVDVFGKTIGDNGEPIMSRVQELANGTARQFKNPEHENNPAAPEFLRGRQEYSRGILDIEIPMADDRLKANAYGYGAAPGITASPDAGLSVTPNPFYAKLNAQQAAAPAQQGPSSAPAQQAAQQTPEPAPAAAAVAASAAASAAPETVAAPTTSAPTPAEMAQTAEDPAGISDEEIDAMLGDNDFDNAFDPELDDVESSLQGQGL